MHLLRAAGPALPASSAIDHRGHGRGIRSRRRFRLEDCADDAVALADELGIDTFIPVGYSMGGPIAQLTGAATPSGSTASCCAATSRNFRGRPIERALFPMLLGPVRRRPGHPGPVADQHRAPGDRPTHGGRRVRPLGPLGDRRQRSPGRSSRPARPSARSAPHDWIGDVDVPTAVVVTERDSVVPPQRQHKLADAIAGATVHPVAADHGAVVMSPGRSSPSSSPPAKGVERRIRDR